LNLAKTPSWNRIVNYFRQLSRMEFRQADDLELTMIVGRQAPFPFANDTALG